ncbi:MAG: GntR family transcriptional regulator [Thermoleophilia bacterium]|nr:GntR family transcriptional regulator [Thermoleophilia bacterium]
MSVAASPAASPTAPDRAASTLRSAILEGALRPGQRVNQETWAARARVSLIPLREALRALAGEGLVTYRPRRGYAVTELDLGELEEVYRLRKLLETDALRRGVPRATTADVASLEAAADGCRSTAASGDVAGQLAANRRFHDRLHALADSRPATRLIDLLWDSTEAYRALYYALPGEAAAADEAHRAIIAAVRAGDPERVVVLQDEHRARALERLRASFRGEADASPRNVPSL